MFDFVISGGQAQRPASRIVAAWIISCLAHCLAIALLIEYPELLRGPGRWQFPQIGLTKPKDDKPKWRTIAVLGGAMTMPSAETLKNLLSDSEKKGPGPKPIRIRLNDLEALLSNQHPKPKVPQEPRNSSPPEPPNNSAPPVSGSATPVTANTGSPAGNPNNGAEAKPPTPIPSSSKVVPPPEVATANPDPNKINNPGPANTDIPGGSAKNPNVSPGGKIASVEVNPGDANKGFPMGEYTNLIAELIKGKWLIPNDLTNSQGRTTVTFDVYKDGHTDRARIFAGSGSQRLDIAALSAVLSCNLPGLPKGFPGDRVGVRFVFSYNEHQ
jgi:TonB family protein